MKLPIGITLALGGAAVLGVRYLTRLKKAGDQIDSKVTVKDSRITFRGIDLVLGVELINPTNTVLRINQPDVTLFSEGKEIAKHNATRIQGRESIEVQPGGSTQLNDLKFQIGLTDLLEIADSLTKKVQSILKGGDEKMKITARIESQVLLGPNSETVIPIRYKKDEVFEI